jgi:hypothetical protein
MMSQHKKEVDKQNAIEEGLKPEEKPVSKSEAEAKQTKEKLKKLDDEKEEKLAKLEEEKEKTIADIDEQKAKISDTERQKKIKPKEYTVETFKHPLTKDEKKEFDDLDEDEQKKFIITRWTAENRTLDTKDMHEISLEDQQFVGLIPVQEA